MLSESNQIQERDRFGVTQVRYNDAIAAKIVEGLTQGLSLVAICDSRDMPDRTTVGRWIIARPDFAAACAQARQDGSEVHVQRILDVNEKLARGEISEGAARVISSNLQWYASKLDRHKWGERIQQDVNTSIEVKVKYVDSGSNEHALDAEYTDLTEPS